MTDAVRAPLPLCRAASNRLAFDEKVRAVCGVLASAPRPQDDRARIVDDPHGQHWVGEARLVAAVTWPTLSNLRTELEVGRACARDIATLAGERCALVECGSGAG
jgi:hypothetical protein